MAKTQAKSQSGRPAWVQAWPLVTLTFAGLVFATLALDWDPIQAQEVQKKAKKGDISKAPLAAANSLTNGKKIDAMALARLIDQEINKRLQAESVKSAGLCDDAEFVRRIHLDLVGVIPTAERVTAFLGSTEPDKRAKLIDELLADPRFGRSVAESLTLRLIPRESNNRALNQKPLENWLAEHFNANTPLNKVVYDLLTTTGEVDKNPAGTYFVGNPTVDKITDNVTRMFLGVQLQCAQCHNHPFTDWKQTEYWAMAAFFMKTRLNGNPQQAAKKGIVLTVSESNKAAGKKGGLPESAKIVPAKFLQGEQPKIDAAGPVRPVLAQWMTSPDNKFFARAMVNRFWHQLFGRGIVNPVDDMHDDNAATHPELLATLTEQFKLNSFDVKFLIRAICNSDVYQRTSVLKGDVASIDPDVYSRREMRVLTPEQMFDSLTTILGKGAARVEPKDRAQKKGGPQSPRGNFISFFRVDEANPLEYQNGIPQALRMMNSPFTNKADVTAGEITKGTKTTQEAIERIYLTALARKPTASELDRLTAFATRDGTPARTSFGDILWVLLNSSEFVLNH